MGYSIKKIAQARNKLQNTIQGLFKLFDHQVGLFWTMLSNLFLSNLQLVLALYVTI